METSDSECFESADEEFVCDEGKILKAATASQKCAPSETVKLEKPSTVEDETGLQAQQINSDGSSVSSEKDNNPSATSVTVKATVNKSERRIRPPRSTLGVKLGTKLNKSDFDRSCDRNQSSKTKSHCDGQLVEGNARSITDYKQKSERTIPVARECFKNNDVAVSAHNVDSSELNKYDDEETNMWENDDWEPVSSISNKPVEKVESENVNEIVTDQSLRNEDHVSPNWSSWGNWGVSSLLSTATMGVTTITNHVSQGITTVLESGIGVPDPEELARLHKADKKVQKLDSRENKNANTSISDSAFGLGSFVSGVTQITKLVETTGNKVISSGLDTLETIGKKTMEVLQEGDPGLKKKRAFLKIETNKPVLSQILREAKEKAEHENKLLEERHFSKRANYETLFDDHQGLVHLEALEMLSKQCDIKLQTLLESHSGSDLIDMQETMGQIKELCELTEDDDEKELSLLEIKEKLDTAASEMNIPISYSKLISTWVEAEQWLENLNLNVCNEMELHEQSINILAQLTAVAVELFHKTGELLLIKEHRSTADEADSLVQITSTITTLIGCVAKKVTDKLSEKGSSSENKDKVNGLITNVYYEATNSSSYIKDAFQLLIPVLQVGAV